MAGLLLFESKVSARCCSFAVDATYYNTIYMTKLKASKHIPLFTTNCYLENNRRQENTIRNGEKENLRLFIACGKYAQIEERRKAGVVQTAFICCATIKLCQFLL